MSAASATVPLGFACVGLPCLACAASVSIVLCGSTVLSAGTPPVPALLFHPSSGAVTVPFVLTSSVVAPEGEGLLPDGHRFVPQPPVNLPCAKTAADFVVSGWPAAFRAKTSPVLVLMLPSV